MMEPNCWDCDGDIATCGALPLAMPQQQQQQQQLVGTDVNIAEVTLNAGMKPALQRFCDATGNPAEKARALELLTALELSSAIKAEAQDGRPRALTPALTQSSGGRRRPLTAAPRLETPASDCDTSGIVGGGGGAGGFSYVNSYETTHNYYYQPPVPSPTVALRPASSQIQRPVPPARELAPGNSFGDLFMSTTYGREFFAKSDAAAAAASGPHRRRPQPERSGSARRVRNNNPHPNREFLVWRYRRPMTATEKIESAATAAGSDAQSSPQPQPQQQQLTNESFDRAVRGKSRSTYQQDFLGLPTTFDVGERAVALLELEVRRPPAYDRSSTQRRAFAEPPAGFPPELSVTKARFGQRPARASPGVLPAGGLGGRRALLDARTRTTYEAHICEPADRVMRVADLREMSSAQNAMAVARMLDEGAGGATGGEQRASLMKLYREMQCRQLPASIPLPVERRIFKERVGGGHTRGVQANPAWLSTWTGPA